MALSKFISLLSLISAIEAAQFAWQNATAPPANQASCKPIPGQQGWPSAQVWSELSAAVKGRLLAPAPPAAACHRSVSGVRWSGFSEDSCDQVKKDWKDANFHAQDPISNMWQNFNDYSCMPDAAAPCVTNGYPVYVVQAKDASDVKAAIDFARYYNIRLNVKSTGHDFLGRSVQPYSLSIWTRGLKSVEWHDRSFTPKGCAGTISGPAVTVGSGQQWSEVFASAKQRNVGIVGGAYSSVSVGGYLSNGGHGHLSAKYGLGADMVLEVQMVTPSGDIIYANECQNQDYFWAMRGGGGSTYGVALKYTLQGVLSGTTAIFMSTLNGIDDAIAMHKAWPRIAARGGAGYITGYPYGNNNNGKISVTVHMPNMTSANLRTLMEPIVSTIKNRRQKRSASNASEPFDMGQYYEYDRWDDARVEWMAQKDPEVRAEYLSKFADVKDRRAANLALPTAPPLTFKGLGANKLLVSWLWSAEDVAKPGLTAAIRGALDNEAELYTDATMGVGTWNPPYIRGGGNAVNPAFRTAVMRVASELDWKGTDPRKLAQKRRDALRFGASLKSIAPNGGTYANEGDPEQPDWQHAFWGSNYPRLFDFKRRVDPTGVFYCRACVGSELFTDNQGVLCRR